MSEKPDRIAKWLAHAGVASRRDCENMIAEKRIRLNGILVEHPATFVQDGDHVEVDGTTISPPTRIRLWRYHKPTGLVTTHKDPQGRSTVFESLPEALPRVVSVGRLDITSEGLLLLTNNGALSRFLELPSTQWNRRYRVRVYGRVVQEKLARLKNGIEVNGVQYGPIEATLDSQKGDNAWLTVSLHEGKNREIRKVLEHYDLTVNRLIRISYGPFQLGQLTKGSLQEIPTKVLREQIPTFFQPQSQSR
ncbi:pseudouridine synthase [Entomobacter blattae]|uniref:Pseudouridine synthase n=1 Tax=Entomobacter blattae TaxID=2762277 RepID=A0A7H1NPM1_9PROT|nr:pseudouridine synthase [Entomobacter blattae]QNT77731.1 Ribosomal large subunit pseudouridine synthase B [Entomobacter blattae]